MLVARAGGAASGFVQLKLEPGWTLKRRAYGKKSLGHLYVYRDSAPIERAPAETDRIESDPVETANPDNTPADTAPAGVQQVESESIDTPLVESAPTPSY